MRAIVGGSCAERTIGFSAQLFPFFRQTDAKDCGPTCLRMIAKFYGRDLSPEWLGEHARPDEEGVDLLSLSEAASHAGFTSQALSLTYADLRSVTRLPAILHWNGNHFVVLYTINGDEILVADPGSGLILFSPEEFLQCWIAAENDAGEGEGVALLLDH
jgi:ATP-binding cassette, subfamily B, bacterial